MGEKNSKHLFHAKSFLGSNIYLDEGYECEGGWMWKEDMNVKEEADIYHAATKLDLNDLLVLTIVNILSNIKCVRLFISHANRFMLHYP